MKSIRKIVQMLAVVSAFIMAFAAMNISAAATEKTWQEAYLELIDAQQHDNESAYLLCYIDDNYEPELYMWDGEHHYYTLYTYSEGESILCDNWSYRESMWIYNNKNGCFWSTRSTNASYQYDNFYKLENGSYNKVYEFCIDRSEMPTEKYLINDENVGQEEYERQMAELTADYPRTSDYQVNGKLEQTYEELRQYLIDSIASENESANKPVTTVSEEASDTSTTKTTATKTTTAVVTEASNSTTKTKREGSPKTGNSEPILCELMVIGFGATITTVLIRKKYIK